MKFVPTSWATAVLQGGVVVALLASEASPQGEVYWGMTATF